MNQSKIKMTTTAMESSELSISKEQIFKLNNSKLIELTKSMIDSGEVTTSLDFATKFMFSLDSPEKFPLNVELLIEWKVYDRKDHCKRALVKHFTEDTDYQVINLKLNLFDKF